MISLDLSLHLGFDTKVTMKDLWKSDAKPLIYDVGMMYVECWYFKTMYTKEDTISLLAPFGFKL